MNTVCNARANAAPIPRERGVVLIIALIVLVAMTLAALALVRSVDTSNLIAGNLAFQQAATQSGDLGVENAAAWLQGQSSTTLSQSALFYRADGSVQGPNAGINETWEHYWNNTLLPGGMVYTIGPVNAAGNTVSYVIDRLCASQGAAAAANCATSQSVGSVGGNSLDVSGHPVNAPTSVYYRITVRIDGPRNTVSFVQSVIAM